MESLKTFLIQNLQSESLHYVFTITIDGIANKISLTIENKRFFYIVEDSNKIHVSINTKKCNKTIEDFINLIEDLANFKYFNNCLVSPKKYELLHQFHDFIRKTHKLEKPICYICLEYSKEYKTNCNHDVCYKCFLKQLKSNNSKCGLCKKCLFCDEECNFFCDNNNHSNI